MRPTRSIVTCALAGTLLIATPSLVLGQAEGSASSTYVTGSAVEQWGYGGADSVSEDAGVMREQGHIYQQRVEWSDPRLPAVHWVRMDLEIHELSAPHGVMTVRTSHLLADDNGSWRGTGRAFETEDDRYSYYELVGEGGYDGLHALLRGVPGRDAHGPWDLEYEGWIIEGSAASYPNPAQPATTEGFVMRAAPQPDVTDDTPEALPVDPMAASAFFYTSETVGEPKWGVETERADGTVIETSGLEMVESIEATDARASGRLVSAQNRTQVEGDGAVVQTMSMTVRLTNEGGSWAGPGEAMLAGSDEIMAMAGMTTLVGEGGYEGLTLYLSQSGDFLDQKAWGLIVPSDRVAPMPRPVEQQPE